MKPFTATIEFFYSFTELQAIDSHGNKFSQVIDAANKKQVESLIKSFSKNRTGFVLRADKCWQTAEIRLSDWISLF